MVFVVSWSGFLLLQPQLMSVPLVSGDWTGCIFVKWFSAAIVWSEFDFNDGSVVNFLETDACLCGPDHRLIHTVYFLST